MVELLYKPLNVDLFYQQLRSAGLQVRSVRAFHPLYTLVDFESEPTEAELQQLQQLYAAHDPHQQTPEQLQNGSLRAQWDDWREKADQVLAQLLQDQQQLEQDLALLDGSPTNAQVLQILRRTAQRQLRMTQYMARLIQIIAYLAKSWLGGG